jgi:acetate kinase
VAVFDTAFHQTMPPVAYMYPLPRELYEKYRIRRYGFHGTSHRYVHGRARLLAGREGQPCKIITAHLGNGCSITAIKDGKVADTSMGFTPLEGLVMGTRSGDIDPSLPLFLLEQGLSPKEVGGLLQKKSGLLGLSNGKSNDMRYLLENYDNPAEPLARLGLDVFCYRLKKYIGAYAAALGGMDVLVFTGGIGENAVLVRQKTCEGLEFLGVEMDAQRNREGSRKEALISTDSCRAKVFVIPTDEELVIAEETVRLVRPAPSHEKPAPNQP